MATDLVVSYDVDPLIFDQLYKETPVGFEPPVDIGYDFEDGWPRRDLRSMVADLTQGMGLTDWSNSDAAKLVEWLQRDRSSQDVITLPTSEWTMVVEDDE